jgi:photosystem II stability/assembly factor-like uncharacterized protein
VTSRSAGPSIVALVPRRTRPLRPVLAVLAAALALAAAGCGGTGDGGGDEVREGVGRAQALAVDGRTGTILVGTDRGLFRVPRAGGLGRVGAAGRDVTALAFARDGALLGSGQLAPGGTESADLGLERSDNGGRSWRSVRLRGQGDLHLLRASGQRLYALNSTTGTVMAARDRGHRWDVRSTPPGLSDLAVDPHAPTALVASSDSALWRSGDGAQTWARTNGPPGALAWSASGRVVVASIDARLHESRDGGRSWSVIGRVPAPLVALAERRGTLLGLLANGSVVATNDRGGHWKLLAQP